MIKAIATDLDGTLFYPKRKIRLLKTKNRKFLKKLDENDIEIVLVTGRNKSIVNKIEKRIKSKRKLSMVGCSGSLIIHDGEVVKERPIDKEKIKNLLKEFDNEPEIKSTIFMGNFNGMLIDPTHFPKIISPLVVLGLRFQGAYYEKSILGRKKVKKMLEDENSKVFKVMPIFGYSDFGKRGMRKAKEFADRMRQKFGDDFEFFESGTAVEILAKGTNKADSLKELFSLYNIKDDEVLVVGDSGNDIPMLLQFPNSFAMKHAPEYVKKTANNEIAYVYELEKYMTTK
ncbi:MAG: Cof-type HAD-IIB family hydrolase [Acholeplasmatales bacterium]|nr:Cof-type HAD-IIB family hydrolase [Acholeplasmatales bacterium]